MPPSAVVTGMPPASVVHVAASPESVPPPLLLPLLLPESSPPLLLPLLLLELSSPVASAPVPESVVPLDEELEQPAAVALTPAPATIKRTTDKASFFIASPISP